MSEFTPEMINEIVAAVKAAGNGGGRARKSRGFKRTAPTSAETDLRRKANDAECIRVFTAAGYKDIKPRINVLTYGKVKPDGTKTGWIAQGRQVRKGQKGLAVGPFNLFHVDQTEPLTATTTASVGTIRDPRAVAEFMTPPAAPASAVSAAPKAEVKADAKWTEWNS